MNSELSPYQVFFDESFDMEFYVIAGYGGLREDRKSFREGWFGLMKNHGVNEAFKMSAYINGARLKKGDKLLDDIAELRMINNLTLFGISHEYHAFERVMGKTEDERFRNRYYSLYARLVTIILLKAERLWRSREVQLVFDMRDEEAMILKSWEEALFFAPVSAKNALRSPPRFVNDENEVGVQLADIAAWITRKNLSRQQSGRGEMNLHKSFCAANAFVEFWDEQELLKLRAYADRVGKAMRAHLMGRGFPA